MPSCRAEFGLSSAAEVLGIEPLIIGEYPLRLIDGYSLGLADGAHTLSTSFFLFPDSFVPDRFLAKETSRMVTHECDASSRFSIFFVHFFPRW